MSNPTRDPLDAVVRYYDARLLEHGATPRGVDWNGREGQELRFEQLMRLVDGGHDRSVLDLGCGYGALLDYMRDHGLAHPYTGIDASASMVAAARAAHENAANACFRHASVPEGRFDYCVASGIFNVRLDADPELWQRYLVDTLGTMHRAARFGFAFNCLTSYSDPERMRPDLHYADPCFLFDYCKRSFSRHVALLHDYGLYEFTILVRTSPAD